VARKSRKHNNQFDLSQIKPALIQTGAYVRLSVDDRAKKGDSIEAQKAIISNYVEEHSEFELYDFYADLNVSGTTFDRPGFHRMMSDAETGLISCIMVKDLSRFGRNMIDTGYYIEKVFPVLGVRLISITDNYDTDTYDGDISLPLMNLVNEAYALDIGRKRRSQARQAMRDGVFVGGNPPYGYMRSPDNHRKLIVDKSASGTVVAIFKLAAEGTSTNEIARSLNKEGIASPGDHKKIMNTETSQNPVDAGRWYARTVEKILENGIYVGRLIQGKTKTKNFQRKPAPCDEWIYANEAHEDIVSIELFQTVKKIRQERHGNAKDKPKVQYSTNIYKGKIFCAHCGGRMERRKNHKNYSFHCISNRTAPGSCQGSRIREDIISDALSLQLIKLINESLGQQDRPINVAGIISELRFLGTEMSNMENLFRSLYESFVTGTISQTDYTERRRAHQIKMEEMKHRASYLQRLLNDDERSRKHKEESMRLLSVFEEMLILTTEHIDRFVSRVSIFNDGRVHFDLLLE